MILNIGGIANIICLPTDNRQAVSGFDTGPVNTLLDSWAGKWLGKPFDESGLWAAAGQVKQDLLAQMLKDPYLRRPPPKSTGPEYFNLEWLQQQLKGNSLDPQDIKATLTEFTALSISQGIKKQAAACQRVIICGGGVFNKHLMRRLQDSLQPVPVETASRYGLDPGLVEATAFAWLPHRTMHLLAGNLPAVTGASHPVVLGGIYPAG